MNALCKSTLAIALLSANISAPAQQPDPLTQFEIKGHVYEPQPPGYFGPRPPPGSPPHRYHFQIFALDVALRLPTGANRHAVLKAAKGHVLAEGVLVGTFRKAP